MAKDLNDFKAKLKQLKAILIKELPAIVEEYANNAKVLSERNIINRGFGEDYSTIGVPAFFFEGKELNNRGSNYIADKKKNKEKLTWADFKEAQGLPTEHVTLSYSNEMWRGIGVVKVEKKGNRIIAYLGGNNLQQAKKMKYNFERYGDFIKKGLTRDDKKILLEDVNQQIKKILVNNL